MEWFPRCEFVLGVVFDQVQQVALQLQQWTLVRVLGYKTG